MDFDYTVTTGKSFDEAVKAVEEETNHLGNLPEKVDAIMRGIIDKSR